MVRVGATGVSEGGSNVGAGEESVCSVEQKYGNEADLIHTMGLEGLTLRGQ